MTQYNVTNIYRDRDADGSRCETRHWITATAADGGVVHIPPGGSETLELSADEVGRLAVEHGVIVAMVDK